jgi:hypothetical protein
MPASFCLELTPCTPCTTPDFTGSGSGFVAAAATKLYTDLDIHVQGDVVAVALEQRFRNDRSSRCNANYSFYVEAAAAVCGFGAKFSVTGNEFKGQVKQRQAARDTYTAAVCAGQQTVLVEQSLAEKDIFTTFVGTIEPGEVATVRLEYVFLNSARMQQKVVVPHELSSRYGSVMSADAAVDGATPASSTTVHVRVEVASSAAEPAYLLGVECVSHPMLVVAVDPVATTKASGMAEFGPEGFQGRDLVLQIREHSADNFKAYVITQEVPGVEDVTYVSALFRTDLPAGVGERNVAHGQRRVLVLVDRSGSMAHRDNGNCPRGWRMVQAKRVVNTIRRALSREDSLGILFFDYACLWGARFGDPESRVQACMDSEWPAAGGTEICRALQEGLTAKPSHVVIVTDAEVKVTTEFEAVLATCPGVQIGMVTIGPAASTSLLQSVRARGGHTHRLLQPNDTVDDSVWRMLQPSLREGAVRFNFGPDIFDSTLCWVQSSPSEDMDVLPVGDMVQAHCFVSTLKLKAFQASETSLPSTGHGLKATLSARHRVSSTEIASVKWEVDGSRTLTEAPRNFFQLGVAAFLNGSRLKGDQAANVMVSEKYNVLGPWTSLVGVASNKELEAAGVSSASVSPRPVMCSDVGGAGGGGGYFKGGIGSFQPRARAPGRAPGGLVLSDDVSFTSMSSMSSMFVPEIASISYEKGSAERSVKGSFTLSARGGRSPDGFTFADLSKKMRGLGSTVATGVASFGSKVGTGLLQIARGTAAQMRLQLRKGLMLSRLSQMRKGELTENILKLQDPHCHGWTSHSELVELVGAGSLDEEAVMGHVPHLMAWPHFSPYLTALALYMLSLYPPNMEREQVQLAFKFVRDEKHHLSTLNSDADVLAVGKEIFESL